jgi:hypothetical protein
MHWLKKDGVTSDFFKKKFGGKFLSFCEKYFGKGIFCNKFSAFFLGKKFH